MVRNAPQPALASGAGHFTKTLDLASHQRGSRKRVASPDAMKKRIRPTPTSITPMRVTNVSSGETIYQRCVIVKGECHGFENASDDFVSVELQDVLNGKHSPQNWPVAGGLWKALIMLEPGQNEITIQHHHAGGVSGKASFKLTYTALAQTPPLHLAILVAKDSPLLINCPPSKYGAISSAHSSLDAAVAKFRMTAYMWQAAIADATYEQGLGRRSFRLEEEWTVDTTKRPAMGMTALGYSMGPAAKIHIVRTDKTTFALQQSDDPRSAFVNALESHSTAFSNDMLSRSGAHPAVAGMILDTPANPDDLRFATHGVHRHINLATFPSHCVYSWPRFMEEITSCLIDPTPADSSKTNGELCQTSQRLALSSALCAMYAEHGSMVWLRELFCSGQFIANGLIGPSSQKDHAQRSLQFALQLRRTPQAQLPGDTPKLLDAIVQAAKLDFQFEELMESDIDEDDGSVDESSSQYQLTLRCEAALSHTSIQYSLNNILQTTNIIRDYELDSIKEYSFLIPTTALLSPSGPLSAHILTGNGALHTLNLTQRLQSSSALHIPNSRIRLHRLSSHSNLDQVTSDDDNNTTPFALLLAHRNPTTRTLSRATDIDLRVGCTFDGLVIRYADSTQADNRPQTRHPHNFGGHASENKNLPPGSKIARVEVNLPYGSEGSIDGIRMTLDSGEVWGELNEEQSDHYRQEGDAGGVVTLEPEPGQAVVGFFGKSERGCGYVREFGLLTAPVGVEDLPEAVWGMEDFRQRGGDTAVAVGEEADEGGESEGTEW